jgi:hypothetical protein
LRLDGPGYDAAMSQTREEQGSTSPGPESDPAPEPAIHPSSTPEGPSTIPAPPVPESDARTQTEQANEELQAENAETSLDQPSDASGNE